MKETGRKDLILVSGGYFEKLPENYLKIFNDMLDKYEQGELGFDYLHERFNKHWERFQTSITMMRLFGDEYFQGRVLPASVVQEMHRQLEFTPVEPDDRNPKEHIVKQFRSGELNYLQAFDAFKELNERRMQMELEKQRRQQEFAKPAPWERDQKRDMSDEAVHNRKAKMCRRSG